MKCVELMIKEHRFIERMLRVLGDSASVLSRSNSVPSEMLAGMLEFIQVYADASHHAKEEYVFFPALGGHGVDLETSAIGALQAQHEVARQLVRRMRTALPDVAHSGSGRRQRFAHSAQNYIDLLRVHMELENELFVEYAEVYLTDDQDLQLWERMVDVDRALPAHERPSRFERMVAEYEQTASRW